MLTASLVFAQDAPLVFAPAATECKLTAAFDFVYPYL
jgi:hypothetical protein